MTAATAGRPPSAATSTSPPPPATTTPPQPTHLPVRHRVPLVQHDHARPSGLRDRLGQPKVLRRRHEPPVARARRGVDDERDDVGAAHRRKGPSRVVPATGLTMARVPPAMALSRLDLPALGLPTMATAKGRRARRASLEEASESSWFSSSSSSNSSSSAIVASVSALIWFIFFFSFFQNVSKGEKGGGIPNEFFDFRALSKAMARCSRVSARESFPPREEMSEKNAHSKQTKTLNPSSAHHLPSPPRSLCSRPSSSASSPAARPAPRPAGRPTRCRTAR